MSAILAPYPVVDTPQDRFDPFADTRALAFRSLDGQTIMPCTGDEFIARWGITGLDVPDRELVEESVPGQDGSDLVDIKVGSRTYFLPLFLGSSSSHLQHLDDMARLRSLFNHRRVDYRTAGGTFDLVGTSAKGERSLRSAYVSGLSGEWAQDSMGAWWRTMGLTFLSVRPYWQGEEWTTPEIRQPEGVEFFGRFPPRLSSSRALGQDLVVVVTGDVDSPAIVEASGPGDSVRVTAPGLDVWLPDGLSAGEELLIDTTPVPFRRVMINGEDAWDRVAPSALWSPLRPGENTINIDISNPSPASRARVYGTAQYETFC